VQRIGELLRQLRGTGATVLIAEQNMHFCLGLASHATVIDKGQIVYTSGIEELKANENIRQRYLRAVAFSPSGRRNGQGNQARKQAIAHA